MINYFKRSEKAFTKFIKKNPYCLKEEWDEYAQKNCLFSANTLMFHMFHDELIEYLNKKNINKFEYLKNMYLWIPIKYRNNKIFDILLRVNQINKTKEKGIGKNG